MKLFKNACICSVIYVFVVNVYFTVAKFKFYRYIMKSLTFPPDIVEYILQELLTHK